MTARRLRMTMRRLGVSALIVLGIALILVFSWPRGEPPAGSGSSPSYAVELTVPAGRPAEVTVRRHDGAPVGLDAVTLEPAMPQMGHAVPAMLAEQVGPGRFTTRGAPIEMPGRWEVLVLLGRPPDAEFMIVPVRVE